MIVDPTAAQIFYKDQLQHDRHPDLGLGWLLKSLMGRGVGVLAHKNWVRVRSPFKTIFGAMSVKIFGGFIEEVIKKHVESLRGRVNPQHKLHKLMLHVVIQVIYGDLLPGEQQEI